MRALWVRRQRRIKAHYSHIPLASALAEEGTAVRRILRLREVLLLRVCLRAVCVSVFSRKQRHGGAIWWGWKKHTPIAVESGGLIGVR